MIGKSQNWVNLPFRNQFLAIVVKSYAKAIYQIFMAFSSFALFLYFLSNILSRIVETCILKAVMNRNFVS